MSECSGKDCYCHAGRERPVVLDPLLKSLDALRMLPATRVALIREKDGSLTPARTFPTRPGR